MSDIIPEDDDFLDLDDDRDEVFDEDDAPRRHFSGRPFLAHPCGDA